MTADTQRPTPDDIAALTYEEARDALIETVAKLESGQADLETSVSLWERGEALAAHCMAALDRAETRLDRADGPAPADATDSEPGNSPDGT